MNRLTLTRNLLVVFFLLTVLFPADYCFAANYDYTFSLLESPGGSTNYQLTISITSSLYDYYRNKDHSLQSYEFEKFVTPYPFKPVADSLWEVYNNEEDFANGVLMFVHQIPYAPSAPQKYPVETIVDNEGDCDLFSFVAASIMNAGGLDVVLFFYETQSHMNLGVYLPQEPNDARTAVYYYSHDGKRYYVAECTGDDWRNGWRVGECPEMLQGASAHIITLENCEQLSPGQVSSSYESLVPSSLSLMLSTRFAISGSTVEIAGSISPQLSGRNITIYVSSGYSGWSVLARVSTNHEGQYSYLWTPSSVGTCVVRASWSGESEYTGADSNSSTILVIPLEWLIMGAIVIISLGILIVTIIVTRPKPQETTLIGPETWDY